jgi:hypothetical protein
MKVSTKFQINPSTNGREKCTQSDIGTDQPIDGPTDRPTDRRTDGRTDGRMEKVFYRGAMLAPKKSFYSYMMDLQYKVMNGALL